MFKEALRHQHQLDFSHLFPEHRETGKTRHSDPYKEFWRYLDLRQHHPPAIARQELRKILLLNLQSLGEEMKGHHPHTAIHIKNQNGSLLFQRPEFFGGDDLRQYYLYAHQHFSNPKERQRFKLENHQMVGLFDAVAEALQDINFGADPENIMHQLVTEAHFSRQNLLVTPQLAVLFPALETMIGKQLPVCAAPQLMTVSPPSEVHNKGLTSFAWLNRTMYIPQINEFILQRDGLFSRYSQTEIAKFLELGTQPLPDLSEAELLAFIQTLPPEFAQQHALAIFNLITSELGEKPVPPIPGATPQMTINIEDLAETLIQIFDWEIENHANDPTTSKTIRARLIEFNNKILHHLGTDTPIKTDVAVAEYMAFYSQRDHAIKPEAFAKEANQRYAKINPVFGQVKLDLSLLECGVGTITGGFNTISNVNMNYADLASKVGATKLDLVKHYEKKSLLDRSKFESVARKLDKNPDLFKQIGECGHCGTTQYLGPCNWCLFCEVKDDWGIKGDVRDLENEIGAASQSSESSVLYKPFAGVTELINDDIYIDHRTIYPHFSQN